MNIGNTKIVYCLSDTRSFRQQIHNSVNSLSKFVPKENIILIVNPPDGYKKIYGMIGDKATIVEGSKEYDNLPFPRFRYKIEMCDIECDNLIFLDCDTIVLRNILELVDGDYDFYGREEPCRSYNDVFKKVWIDDAWKTILQLYNKNEEAIPYNDGFMIFKNGIHKKIKDEIIEFCDLLYNKKIEGPLGDDLFHSLEFAISLAVANYNCKNMEEDQHLYGWRGVRQSSNPYVVHVGTNESGLEGYLQNLNIVFGGNRPWL